MFLPLNSIISKIILVLITIVVKNFVVFMSTTKRKNETLHNILYFDYLNN